MNLSQVAGPLRRIVAIAALSAGAAATAQATLPPGGASPDPVAHPRCPMHDAGGDGSRPRGMMAALEGLQLDAGQRSALQALGERFRARGVELRQRGVAIADDMKSVEPDDPGYAAATDRASEAGAALAADAVRLAAELRAGIHAILTDEQRQALRARSAEERKDWDEWRERHRPPE